MDQVVLRAKGYPVAPDRIAAAVLGRFRPDRVPVADIRPVKAPRRHARLGRALHEAVIEGDGADIAEARPRHLHPQIGFHRRHRITDRRDRLRLCGLDRVQEPSGTETEHPCVPQAAFGQKRRRPRRIRLFHETLDLRGAVLRPRTRLDIAIAGRGTVRHHADDRDSRPAHRSGRHPHRLVKCVHIGDQVVRGHDGDQRVGIVLRGDRGGQQHRRQRIAPLRLDHHAGVRGHGGGLVADREPDRVGADHDRVGETLRHHPAQGRLQHRLIAQDRQKLLGHAFARHRPKPRARPAAQDYGKYRIRHSHHSDFRVLGPAARGADYIQVNRLPCSGPTGTAQANLSRFPGIGEISPYAPDIPARFGNNRGADFRFRPPRRQSGGRDPPVRGRMLATPAKIAHSFHRLLRGSPTPCRGGHASSAFSAMSLSEL